MFYVIVHLQHKKEINLIHRSTVVKFTQVLISTEIEAAVESVFLEE